LAGIVAAITLGLVLCSSEDIVALLAIGLTAAVIVVGVGVLLLRQKPASWSIVEITAKIGVDGVSSRVYWTDYSIDDSTGDFDLMYTEVEIVSVERPGIRDYLIRNVGI
jgi:hypothetical protein